MNYTIILDSRSVQDIQQAIDYYNQQQPGLGSQFEKTLDEHFVILQHNPFFRVRYDNVRCLPMKRFPYMIHFTADEQSAIVIIQAVLHTAGDPQRWHHHAYPI